MTWQPWTQRPLPGAGGTILPQAAKQKQHGRSRRGSSGQSAHNCPCLGAAEQDSSLKAGEVALPGEAQGMQP